jgi:hypothetical protein
LAFGNHTPTVSNKNEGILKFGTTIYTIYKGKFVIEDSAFVWQSVSLYKWFLTSASGISITPKKSNSFKWDNKSFVQPLFFGVY